MPLSCLPGNDKAYLPAVCGGHLYAVGESFNVSCFNPKKNTWKSKNSQFIPCIEGCAVSTYNEELYLTGNVRFNGVVGYDCYKYNPKCNEWKQVASMETGRSDHTAVALNDLIYVIGGHDYTSCLKSVESYNPSTDQWQKVPDLTNARQCSATATACGKIVVVGGYSDLMWNGICVDPTCEVFDPCLNHWSLVSNPKDPRADCGVVSVDDTVYVFGGLVSNQPFTILHTVECFDLQSNKWHEVDANMPKSMYFARASLVRLPKMFIRSSSC